MKTKASKPDLSRLSNALGFQFAAILEFQRLGLIDRDLSNVKESDPFLVRMKAVWSNRRLMQARLAGLPKHEREELIREKEVGDLEADIMEVFVKNYRTGEAVTTEEVLGRLLYAHAITPETIKKANQIRRAARERVRREKKCRGMR